MTTLGAELCGRGHRVTLFGALDIKRKVVAAGLDFRALGAVDYPEGSVSQQLSRLGNLSGLAALKLTINQLQEGARVVLDEAPGVMSDMRIEALLVDQVSAEGGTVADILGIPYLTVCNALILNQEPRVPPALTLWPYTSSWAGVLRNLIGYTVINRLSQPVQGVINQHRQRWGLPLYNNINDSCSKLVQLSQQPKEFEFPRHALAEYFHFTGPYINQATREPIAFPFEKLTGQPLIYASLGTLHNQHFNIFNCIAAACLGLNVQLVISFGGIGNQVTLQKLPENSIIVEYAPQLELLQKAALAITHAGMNTVLEALSNGVPLVAIPIATDQKGVAARVLWSGTGEIISFERLSVSKLKAAIQLVLANKSFKTNTTKVKEAIDRAGGVSHAANIIELAISTGKPVVR